MNAPDTPSGIKIALGGGGGAADSRLLDEVFAGWLRPQGRLLYLPCALRGIRPFETCLEWITATFAPLHIGPISMWTDLTQHRDEELNEFDGVYIGGGRTFNLMVELQQSGYLQYLKEFGRRGKAIYGGSAGAVVLGRDIETVSYLEHNEAGLTDMQGLNLVQDHAVWVHYQPQDDGLIEEYQCRHGFPVLALSERSGVVISSQGMRAVGFEPAYRFDERGKTEV